MPRVLIGAATLRSVDGAYRQVLGDAGYEIVFPTVVRQMSEDEILVELKDIDAVLAGSEPYTSRVLDANPQLKVIARNGVGYDAIDVAACTARGVAVTISPANQEAVAEHTLMLMLAVAKGLVTQHNAVRAGAWTRYATQPLRGRTLGLAGLGRIGRAVAERALAFGMRVIAHEPYPDGAFVAKHSIPLVSLEDLFAQADFVSLHMPLTPESRGAVGATLLGRMKPSSYLINTARGPIIDECALYDALANKRIAGAGLDVFENEPPVGCPLLGLDNVVLTAHTAGVDTRSGEEMSHLAAQTIVKYLRGEWPKGVVVNPEVRKK
ncbi:MAG: phosphoglycerate dehydrogenase [Gemmataceae bacterium]